jgi:hypothetical protein
MTDHLFYPDSAPGRGVNVHLDVDLTVDRNRDLDQLAQDLLAAVEGALTAHGRTGRIEFAQLDDDRSVFGRLFMRSRRADGAPV